MIGIAGGHFEIGESDAELLSRYFPDRILPRARYTLAAYCVSAHPFPGKPGLPWPVDGLGPGDLPHVEAVLHQHGLRLCTAPELSLAAAGPQNRRYPWHASERNSQTCETDDLRPASLGSRAQCRSQAGLWDLQVRSSWIRMDAATRSLLKRPDDESSPGYDSSYWLWGGTARDDTYYAPSNFGLHHHLPGTPGYHDDGLRTCADPGETSTAQVRSWARLLAPYPENASFRILLDAKP